LFSLIYANPDERISFFNEIVGDDIKIGADNFLYNIKSSGTVEIGQILMR
jgi:hypothetical protein